MNKKKKRKIELKIDKEKIKNLYKLKLYQIDLNGERHYKNGYLTISTKCDMVYKNYDISDILKYGNFKPAMDVLNLLWMFCAMNLKLFLIIEIFV